MADGRWPMGDGRWAMGDGRWAMGDGRWAMGDGRWERFRAGRDLSDWLFPIGYWLFTIRWDEKSLLPAD